jgi:hypothetical protein
MRALCVQQPWAGLIADGLKTLEVRSWSTQYRGPVLIVASKLWSRHDAASRWESAYLPAPRGVGLCIVELVDIREGRARDKAHTGGVDPTGYLVWELRNAQRVEPFALKGRLSLFPLSQVETAHIRLAS